MIFVFLLLVIGPDFQHSVEKLIDNGYDKYLDEDYAGAIDDFNKASALAPDNEEIYFLRGVCKSNIDQKAAAMNDFNKALQINPHYAEVYYEKAYLYLQDRNAPDAIESLNRVIELRPDMAAAYVSRGTARCMMEDIEGANADWDKAKELGVDYSELMVCE